MTSLTTDASIRHLEERYPFTKEELEVIVHCHDQMQGCCRADDFLMKMAKALPYSFLFLPGDELGDRVRWLEENLLPKGFSSRLFVAMTSDSFVDYANQGEDRSVERLIEGIADTGRRGSSEALRVTYDILGEEVTAEKLVELCIVLALASEALISPNFDKELLKMRIAEAKPCILSMARSLSDFCEVSMVRSLNDFCGGKVLDKKSFIAWAEENFPNLSSTLSTFVHHILFHGHPFPKTRVPYVAPKLCGSSGILETENSPLLLSLSFSSHNFGGTWKRLYSTDEDGRSFNRLEWSLLGYSGPTIMLIKTTSMAVLGAHAASEWKEWGFLGDSKNFLFQLEPKLAVYRPQGGETNFAFLHTPSKSTLTPTGDHEVKCGLGFGGSPDKPRLFIPESFEGCEAAFYDKTYRSGDLLPEDSLETFEIGTLEIWGVGGEKVIEAALQHQEDYRQRHQGFITQARTVRDKSEFVKDLKSGLIPNSIYEHKEQIRGRGDFVVDNEHGGYKIDRE